MQSIVNPILLYLCLAAGGVGVLLALPRPRVSPQVIGALIAAAAFGGLFLALALAAGENRPSLFFYLFSLIGLGSALRVITHPKPVYAALYFITTILASSALYLIIGAEFMAFALIIIYAGAILITYLFVIMLASQAPSEDDPDGLTAYDTYSREPVVSTGVGFALLAIMTGMIAGGVGQLKPAGSPAKTAGLLEQLPRKVLSTLERRDVFKAFEKPALADVAKVLDVEKHTLRLKVTDREQLDALMMRTDVLELLPLELKAIDKSGGRDRPANPDPWMVNLHLPDTLKVDNIDGIGFALIAEHPMALELAGVILLMAMLGAVVLARKQIEQSEDEKAAAARLAAGGGA